jgi:hypothetical protein
MLGKHVKSGAEWHTTIRAALAAALVLGVSAACSDDNPTTAPSGSVAVSDLQLKPGTETGLLAIATFTTQDADSARVWYTAAGGEAQATPFVPVSDGTAQIVIPALEPGTQYDMHIEARDGADSAVTQTSSFTTQELPDALKNLSIQMSTGAFPAGYILTETEASDSTLYALAFDSTGRLAWYRHFPDYHQILDLQQQPNGHFTIYLGGSTGSQPVPGEFAEFTLAGDITHRWALPDQYYMDGHEIRFAMQDTTVVAAYLFGYDQQPMDMSGHGGGPDSLVSVHKIFKLSPSGDAQILFDALDRWTLDDWTSPPLDVGGDMDHPNSLDFDSDGNLIVSWRHLGAVTKHDPTTGEVLWQFGGTKSDFALEGDALNGFGGQHFARMLPDEHILIYDNGTNHDPGESRSVEYALDESNKTATFVSDFRHSPRIFTTFMGSAQRLPNGNTLIGYSTDAIITEVDPSGNTVAEGRKMDGGTPSIFYRAIWIPTLADR